MGLLALRMIYYGAFTFMTGNGSPQDLHIH